MFINRLGSEQTGVFTGGNNMRGNRCVYKRMLMLCYQENSKHSQSLRHTYPLYKHSQALFTSIFKASGHSLSGLGVRRVMIKRHSPSF